jgi:hypothetical protein
MVEIEMAFFWLFQESLSIMAQHRKNMLRDVRFDPVNRINPFSPTALPWEEDLVKPYTFN